MSLPFRDCGEWEQETSKLLLGTSDVLASGFRPATLLTGVVVVVVVYWSATLLTGVVVVFLLVTIKGKELKSYERTEGNCVRLLENDGERELRPNSLLHQRRAGFPVSGQRFG